MKKLFLTGLIFFLGVSVAIAGSAMLEWTPLPDPANGVRVYVGTETGVYQWSHDAGIGVSETIVKNLAPGIEYFFAAKAYNPKGVYSTTYSNEVFYTVPGEDILPALPDIEIGGVTITIKRTP